MTLWNCFWLMVPLLIWNLIFASKLSQPIFTSDVLVPQGHLWLEDMLRFGVFIYPLFLPLSVKSPRFTWGITVWGAGTLVYFASWLAVLYAPASAWSSGWLGLLAPFYLPFIIFSGIAILANSPVYMIINVAFTIVHIWHGVINLRQ